MLVAVAVAIKLNSPGGVFFVQQRSGRGGRFFRLYKFRSMKVDSTVLVRDDGAIVKRPTTTGSRASGASSGASRWTRRRSCSTS